MEKSASRKINLIPQDLAVPAKTVKLAAIINKISTFSVIILILTIFAFGGFIYYLSQQVTTENKKVESLKSKVISLSTNEQKMVLAKDRLNKISIVQKDRSVDDEISRFKKFSDLATSSNGSISINEANLTNKATETSVVVKDAFGRTSLLKPLADLAGYKTIVLSSLTYSPGIGFLINISFEN